MWIFIQFRLENTVLPLTVTIVHWVQLWDGKQRNHEHAGVWCVKIWYLSLPVSKTNRIDLSVDYNLEVIFSFYLLNIYILVTF